MAFYSEKVMDHFRNPRNVGVIEDADGIGEVGNAKCGDIMKIYLKIENDIIADVKFETFGCGSAIASSSMATELIKGKPVSEALSLTNKAVVEALDGLPAHKIHCSVLAEEAIKKALRDYYDKNYSARTLDDEYNMVRVGNALAKVLSENGIGVVHDTTVHDYPSYNGSYDRSAETVEGWLSKYPTIKVVLDIHRDAIERTVSGETVRVKPTTEIDGKKAAQLMIIAGCDDGEMGMPNWRENLRFAAALQNQLETEYPTLTRPVMLDYRKYNQNLTTGSLLIEVGGHANSLDEAIYSAELIGKSLSKLLKTYMD